jgi:hypothetical protein
VFVHSGSGSATTAVFHIQSATVLDEVKLWSETVGNGNNGNGFAVGVRAVVNGVAQAIGGFNFDYAGTLNTYDEHIFAPGLLLQAGDVIEIAYGNRDSYLYDHGNVEAFLTLSPAQVPNNNPVPEPGSLALALTGLAAMRIRRAQQSEA